MKTLLDIMADLVWNHVMVLETKKQREKCLRKD